MHVQRCFRMDRPDVERLIHQYGWATLVTATEAGGAAAHVPCLLETPPGDDDQAPGGELVVLSHTARADPVSQDLARAEEVLLIFQGPHGYISPAWYEASPYVGTWNFTSVHIRGVPELLEGEPAFEVLRRTQDHFETAMEEPFDLEPVIDFARAIAAATVPFRMVARSVEAKAKLSQDKPREVQDRVIAALERPGPYRQPALAAEMRRVLGRAYDVEAPEAGMDPRP